MSERLLTGLRPNFHPRTLVRTLTRSFAIVTVLLLCTLRSPAARENYVGDDACRSCHATQVDSFHQTAHFLTSAEPNEHTILGKFTTGDNIPEDLKSKIFPSIWKPNKAASSRPRTPIANDSHSVGSGEKAKPTCSGMEINSSNYPCRIGPTLAR
jgi:hypothetical protein